MIEQKIVCDMQGFPYKVGQTVAKAYRTGDLRILKVSKIIDGKVYLGRATNPMYYPQCALIINDSCQ